MHLGSKMRHGQSGKKLGRTAKQRKALFRGSITSFLERGRLKTTLAKAKAVRPLAERLITLAREDSLASRRKVFSLLKKKVVAEKLLSTLAPSFRRCEGGYTRLVRLGARRGDRAEMARLELVEPKKSEREEGKKGKKGKRGGEAKTESAGEKGGK